MKLSRIYSNKKFKTIKFNEGFNAVLATIHDVSKKKDTHNLGKTSLIYVIDFLLLGKFDKRRHLLSNSKFSGYQFYGEFVLNNGEYLIIHRAVDLPTKASFKRRNARLKENQLKFNWDYQELPFNQAKHLLNEYLRFDVLPNWIYRQSITYFLRTQKDFGDVFQLNKFKGQHKDWKPLVFDLLGFNGELIKEKANLEENKSEINERIKTIKSEINVDLSERDKLLGLLDIKQGEIAKLSKSLDRFNFFEKDKNINENLIRKLDFELQQLNSHRYTLSSELEKTNTSIQSIEDDGLSFGDLERLFNETEIYFERQLRKEFSELVAFNRSISEERLRFLKINASELSEELKAVNVQIKSLEEEKSALLSFLVEKDSYQKFKSYQQDLAKTASDVDRLQDKIKYLDQVQQYEEKLDSIDKKIKKQTEVLRKAIANRNHAEVNKQFDHIIFDVLHTHALLIVNQNKQGNVEFNAEYQNPADLLETSQSKGFTYKKFLCMAFDLSILMKYSKNSFYKFVYHDGALEAIDNRRKINYLNKIKEICEDYKIQYVLTSIDSDLPYEDGQRVAFQNDEICLELHDKDDSGKLFMMSF